MPTAPCRLPKRRSQGQRDLEHLENGKKPDRHDSGNPHEPDVTDSTCTEGPRQPAGSKVVSAVEERIGFGPDRLVDGDPVASWCSEGAAGSVWNFEYGTRVPAGILETGNGRIEVVDAVDEDRALTFEVVREQEMRRTWSQRDHCNSGVPFLDGKGHPTTEDTLEVGSIPRNIGGGNVEEVE
jgi:hypothetical protein